LYRAETGTVQKVYKIHLGRREMWCWNKTDISWTDRVRKEALQRIKEERNIIQTTKTSKANWIGDILCRSCQLRYVTEGKTKGRSDGKPTKKT
jgi:hypothetical protein